MGDETDAKWRCLLDEEEQLFQRACALDRANPDKTPAKAAAARDWWRAANAVLWMFTRTSAQEARVLEPVPHWLLGRLANVAEELSNGNMPDLVADCAMGGVTRWRAERHHIAYAVFYLEAVERGEIEDKSPNKTVRECYGVTSRAVQKWRKERDLICVGVPVRQFSADNLRNKMMECGAVYKRIGRGVHG